MKLRQNKKGVTLIESIVTIAIIAILLGTMGVALTNIIHYIGESALIKNTSNEIFSDIQNPDYTKFTTSDSIMTFRDGLTVTGTTKTVEKSYNDKDKLSLSQFEFAVQQNTRPVIENAEVEYYLAYFWNDHDKSIQGNKNLFYSVETFNNVKVYSDTDLYTQKNNTDSTNLDLIHESFDNLYNVNDLTFVNAFDAIKDKNSGSRYVQDQYDFSMYGNLDKNNVEIYWYKVHKQNEHQYQLYGFVKPKGTIITTFTYYIFGKYVYFIDPINGISSVQYSALESKIGDILFEWQSDKINNGESLKLEEMKDNKDFFKDISPSEVVDFQRKY